MLLKAPAILSPSINTMHSLQARYTVCTMLLSSYTTVSVNLPF
jgi:hypothetical protein